MIKIEYQEIEVTKYYCDRCKNITKHTLNGVHGAICFACGQEENHAWKDDYQSQAFCRRLKLAMEGNWSDLKKDLETYGYTSSPSGLELYQLAEKKLALQQEFNGERPVQIADPHAAVEFQQLKNELTTERETTQQALQTSQEWHERQKEEIIAEWKGKLTNLINQRKATIQQEITLLRNLLNHHDQ